MRAFRGPAAVVLGRQQQHSSCEGRRVLPRSEIKEEAAGRGTFAEGSTRWPSHTPPNANSTETKKPSEEGFSHKRRAPYIPT
ncbi:hypothetical protein SAMN05518669_10734 [Variovorax sp. YR634]|jgi:hypothetical protein|nr:hypothetical protein SAMN05518669_10734 [Variovorax sp. YR634]